MTKKEFERFQRFFGSIQYKPMGGLICISLECPQVAEFVNDLRSRGYDSRNEYGNISIDGDNFTVSDLSVHFKWVKSVNIYEMKHKWKDVGGYRESKLNHLFRNSNNNV